MKRLAAFVAIAVAAFSQARPLPEAWTPHERGAEGKHGFPATGGIDFWKDDALHVPPSPVRNLLANGGFEQGFKGWRWQFGGTQWADVPKGKEKHGIVDGGRFGRKALIVRNGQPAASPLWKLPRQRI